VFSALMVVFLVGCVEDVSKDKVEATVSEVKEVQKAAGEAWKVDASASSVRALGAKITATHPIDFKTFEGDVTVEGDAVTGVRFTVQMESLVSDNERLTGHLKNEDFFDVANHPTATFESTGITAGGTDGATHTVAGNLTIRGTTKGVTFPATISIEGGAAKARSEFAIDRKDFNVVYPGKPDDLVQDKVVLTIDFVAKKG
jgi:polyisoprenoid-binding protein YceI